MSLHTVTDIEVRPRRGGVRFLLAALALAAHPSVAQELVRPPSWDGRVVAIRSQSHRPLVYGTPGVPFQLVFDAPLGDVPLRFPGGKARRHASLADTLVVIPSQALVRRRGPVPLVVPLATGGTVTVGIVARPEAPDRRVFLVRAGASSLAWRTGPPELGAGLLAPWVELGPVELGASPAAACTVPACRMNVLVRTPRAPEGHLLEIRSADPAFCAALSR